jgi:hypothetical protein
LLRSRYCSRVIVDNVKEKKGAFSLAIGRPLTVERPGDHQPP